MAREKSIEILLMMPRCILLVDPVYNCGTVPPNVSLGRLEASLLESGKNVEIVDFVSPDCEHNDLDYFNKKESLFIANILKKAEFADIIYITSGHGNELKPYPIWPRIRRIVTKLKNSYPNKKIAVGGALVNLYKKVYKLSDRVLSGEYIDYIIPGHENNALLVLGGTQKGTFDKTLLWNAWNKANYPDFRSLIYHVGCQYACDFCFEGKVFENKNNIETVGMLLKSIEMAKNDNGITKFVIEDSTFMSYPDIGYLLAGIAEQHVEFSIYARISEIIKKPKLVSELKRSGCSAFIIGIETLNDDLLKKHHKGLVTQQTRMALDIIKDNGIQVQGCFMLGFPEDSLDNMRRTVDFAVDENMNGYRWHIYQPNFMNLDSRFYSKEVIKASDHMKVQLNVPDHCLGKMMDLNPKIGVMDEHFLPRARNVLDKDNKILRSLGYRGRFNYSDLLSIINILPKNMILNEERLYLDLFKQKQR